jgi:hypothetical protein
MTITEHMKNHAYPSRMGEDRILRRGEQLVICSKVDMDEWQVQGTRKTAVIIEDDVWCLVGKEFTDSKEVHYILEPYSDYLSQLPGRRIRYDEEYVRICKGADDKKKIEARSDTFLYPFRAFIGFLSSQRKAAIEKKFSIPARNATFASILIEFYVLAVLGFFWWVFALLGAIVIPVYLAVLVLFIDIIFRYGSYLREDASPLGFLEWLFRFLHRKSESESRPGTNAKNIDPVYPYK